VELRQLRYFLVLAEELHFTRAAARIPLAQPALSQQVQRLERELGARLLDRGRGPVELTEAGQLFADHARRVIKEADDAVAAVRAHTAGRAGRLRVGLVGHGVAELNDVILSAYTDHHPRVEVSLVDLDIIGQADRIVAGEVDVALSFGPFGDERLHTTILATEPSVVAVPRRDDLADAPVVDQDVLEAVLRRPLLPADAAEPPEWDAFFTLKEERGEDGARVDVPLSHTIQGQMLQLILHRAVLAVPASIARFFPMPGLAWLPAPTLRGCPLNVVQLADHHDPLVESFVTIARAATRAHLDLVPDPAVSLPDPS